MLIGTGLALGSLAGLELSIREHFAGYRSHTLLLAGAAGRRRCSSLLPGPGLACDLGLPLLAGAVVFGVAPGSSRAPSGDARAGC